MITKNSPIAVVDSGMGGITVLKKLYRIMPNENYIYFGDSANSPYGTKTKEEIKNLTVNAVEALMKRGAKSVVIACNTATSAAADTLREKYPNFPFVGLEPALKPAALSSKWPRVLVMATNLTLREEKFNKLMARFEDDAEFIKLPAPELVGFVESAMLYSLSFDLLVPPFDLVKVASVEQINAKIESARMSTGKRMGYKYNSDDILENE